MKKIIAFFMALCMVVSCGALAADKVNQDMGWVYEAIHDTDKYNRSIYSIPAFNINTADAQMLNDEFVRFYKELDKGWHYNSTYKEYLFEDYLSAVVISKGDNDYDAYCAKTINLVTGEAVRNSELISMAGFTEETFLEYLYNILKEHSDETLARIGNDPYGSYKKMYVLSLTDKYCNLDIPMYISDEGHLIIVPGLMSSAGIYIQAVDTGYAVIPKVDRSKQDSTQEISVYVNDEKLEFDQPPVIIDGRTLVPIRAICEAMGFNVTWNSENIIEWYGTTTTIQTVKITDGVNTLLLEIGSKTIQISDGKEARNDEIDVAAQIVNDRTLVPARVVAEAFGADVSWDDETRTVRIESHADALE